MLLLLIRQQLLLLLHHYHHPRRHHHRHHHLSRMCYVHNINDLRRIKIFFPSAPFETRESSRYSDDVVGLKASISITCENQLLTLIAIIRIYDSSHRMFVL
mmetsp:Transcript_15749/g.25191  ORF Transcript_15749/g.25191 Transcript_15749/m.25191 type:complete len:101 (+) Transcript_15749:324-626(+)